MEHTGKVLYRLFYHICFSTRHRMPLLTPTRLQKVRQAVHDKCTELGIDLIIANGYLDHIHLLVVIPPTFSVSSVVKELKGYSSWFVNKVYWQRGYSVFSVSEKNCENLYQYILRQKEHHSGRTT